MKKKRVTSCSTSSAITCYRIDDSEFGSSKTKDHPYWTNIKHISKNNGLVKGDIVRCDGFPFMARPPTNFTKVKGKLCNTPWAYTHKPFRLQSGLWVLREIGEVS